MSSDPYQLTIPDPTPSTTASTKRGRTMTSKKTRTKQTTRVVRTVDPTPEQVAELTRQRKARGLSFTVPQARAAMEEKSQAWGYAPDYYRLTDKVGRRYQVDLPDDRTLPAQDYRVEVRLFSGRITTAYRVRFVLDRGTHCYHKVLGVLSDGE